MKDLLTKSLTRGEAVELQKQTQLLLDAAEMLWVVLANVSESDWMQQSVQWQKAARRWRDNYFKVVEGFQ